MHYRKLQELFTILHDHLGMQKLRSKWVPHLMTPDQKPIRVNPWRAASTIFKRNRQACRILELALGKEMLLK